MCRCVNETTPGLQVMITFRKVQAAEQLLAKSQFVISKSFALCAYRPFGHDASRYMTQRAMIVDLERDNILRDVEP